MLPWSAVQQWMKERGIQRRINEAFYIARFHPELNKQVQSLHLTLFPMGTGLRHWQYLNTEHMHIIHSDDDLLDRKRLDPISTAFYL